MEPSIARGLKQLLEFEGDIQETFQFYFQVTYQGTHLT
jgi:hypothetical protein